VKHVIETGTDVAMVTCFDPSALPNDFDRRVKEDLDATFKAAAAEGRLWIQATGADGAYLFHFYVDEDVPARIQTYSEEPKTVDCFHVPSGTLWACGAEYAACNPLKAGLDRFSHMGAKFELLPGEYALTAWRIEWPEGMEEREMEMRLGKSKVSRYQRMGVFSGILCVSTFLATFFAVIKSIHALTRGGFGTRLRWFWGVLIFVWSVCISLMWKLTKTGKDPRRMEVALEFPGIVIHMKKLG